MAVSATTSAPPAACVHELFEAQAARTPDAVAIRAAVRARSVPICHAACRA